MSYIVSTRNPIGIYKILIESCRKHSEKVLNKNLKIIVFKKNKTTLRFILFYIINILNFKVFNDYNFSKIKYKNCDIGRHTLSRSLREKNSYLNSFYFNIYKLKYFFEAGSIIETSFNLLKNTDAIYVDHGVYLNGLIIQVFANNNKIIYQNVYPRGLSYKDLRKYNRNFFLKHEDLLILKNKEIKLTKKQKNISYKKLKQILFEPQSIPWIKGTKFIEIKKEIFSKFTHVIYTHSFADGQLVWGTDEFSDMRQWLIFTLKELDKDKNKVLVKSHPNFTIRGYFNEACKLDRKIFLQIKKNFKFSKNLYFEDKPTKNIELLTQLNKKTILISHHGSAILEGSFQNFKLISSSATFWDNEFKISNCWKTKDTYKKLLNIKWKKLKHTDKNDLLKVSYLLYCNKYGHYGKKFWHQIISEVLKISRIDLDKTIERTIGKIENYNEVIKRLSNNIQKI